MAKRCDILVCEAVQALKAHEATESTSLRVLLASLHPIQDPDSVNSEATTLL